MGVINTDYDFDPYEEIERKAIESLEQLNNDHETGRISDVQYRLALRTIDQVTRGLVSEPVSLAIDQETTLLPAQESFQRTFIGKGRIYVTSHVPGEDHYVLFSNESGKFVRKKIQGEGDDPVKAAGQSREKFEKKLKALGFKQMQ